MKNILIICGTFPPQSLVGGLRPAMFAKYLPNFGWNPWVLTRNFTPEDPRYNEKMPVDFPWKVQKQIIRFEYSLKDEQKYLRTRDISKLIRDFFYPEYSSPPGVFFVAKRTAELLLVSHQFDLILATIPDQWELTLGAYLSKKFGIPLIADFRDIKEQERGLKRTFRQWIQNFRFSVRRSFTLMQASGITTVSKFHRDILNKKFKKATFLIYNGFDDQIFSPSKLNRCHDGPFRIVYMGRILNLWYRNPEILFLAIDQLIIEGLIEKNAIVVEFYGTDREKLNELLSSLKNTTFVKFHERIIHTDIPKKLSEAQLVLLLTNIERKGILTTKLFEYAGVKKPILCIPGDRGELDEIIKVYELGYSISSVLELKIQLVKWLQQYRMGEFPQCIESKIEIFSRKNQTKLLAEILDQINEMHYR